MTINITSTPLPNVAGLSHPDRESRPAEATTAATPISEPILGGLVAASDAGSVFLTAIVAAAAVDVNFAGAHHLVAALAILGAGICVAFWHAGRAYTFDSLVNFKASVSMVAKGFAAMIALQLAFSFFIGLHRTTLPWLALWLVGGVQVIALTRMATAGLVGRWDRQGRLKERIAIIGVSALARQIMADIASREPQTKSLRAHVVGIFDDRPGLAGADPRLNGLTTGSVKDLIALIRQNRIDAVVIAVPLPDELRIVSIIEELRHTPVDVRICLSHGGLHFNQSIVGKLGQHSLVTVKQRPLCHWKRVAKDVEDRVLGFMILAMISPVMAAIAVAIKLDSPGPVFFKQKRYGYNNQLIEVLKFRSMYHAMSDANAEKLTERNDPRVTKLGAFLRRTSLDELPQFINVVRGDMSIVGPRPHATKAKAGSVIYQEAVQYYDSRHRMKPGITGWAQVNGWRGETQTIEQIARRVEHDVFYIENWTIAMDLKIIVRTIFGGFTGTSAY